MTNNWHDIGNASCVLVWGANPAENHPACMAHINVARAAGAKLVVVDPRKTRTALQADQYIRIRPGTDIALQNGVVREIMSRMDAGDAQATDFFTYLNQSGNGSFYTDGSTTAKGSVSEEPVSLTVSAGVGVVKMLANHTVLTTTSTPAAAANAVVTLQDVGRTPVAAANYTLDLTNGSLVLTAAGVTAFPTGVDVFITYEYESAKSVLLTNVSGASKYTDARFIVDGTGSDYARATLNAGTNRQMSGYPTRATDCRSAYNGGQTNTVYERLKAHVAPYTTDVVANICDCTESEIADLATYFIDHSRMASVAAVTGASQDPTASGYRALTILYAMGITQHTYGAQNIKGFANLQTLMGNMGRCGGGINALRGIHNVQGSTDMGLLYGNIPAYSDNPTVQFQAIADGGTEESENAFGHYMDKLWGNPISGRPATLAAGQAGRALMDHSYYDAYNKTGSALGALALQQAGFLNMTLKWFGDYDKTIAQTDLTLRRPMVDAAYSVWPKGNGSNHITMYREMAAGTTKAAMVWGMNPAVTEPNQSKVREGLYEVDMLVCVDMFETETAAVDRKSTDAGDLTDGVTYLIPACAHVEKAGSVTNSSRTLQWRYLAKNPAGNSKDDLELMLRFAKALDVAGAFSHVSDAVPLNTGGSTYASVYERQFSSLYGGFDGLSGFAALNNDAETVVMRTSKDGTVSYTTGKVYGSEWVAECVYREMTLPSANGGTIWIYTGAYNNLTTATVIPAGFVGAGSTVPQWQHDNRGGQQALWGTMNRAKSRDNFNDAGTKAYHGWGYAWLVNRRVLYNNSDIPGDVADYYMGPDSCSRLFTSTSTSAIGYSRWYRKVHLLKDTPRDASSAIPAVHTSAFATSGRFPSHTEPYETPRPELVATWGKNATTDTTIPVGTHGGAASTYQNLCKSDTPLGTSATYPLVLTTIRCVEHFQGGPITRNNWWNVALEPEPWIEINSVDAAAATPPIADGDYVRIVTARTEAFTGHTIESVYPAASYGDGFRARVGVGQAKQQRVGQGVVAIPWHWGDRGLSKGSRANDLCIDAMDANTTIPEYKACLCRIEKIS